MKPLSPAEALNPAFARMRLVLGKPFRFWFFLKITLVAALTQPSFIGAMFQYPLQAMQFGLTASLPHRHVVYGSSAAASFAPSPAAGMMVVVFAIMAGVGLILWVVVSYLYCRLRFTLFDLVIYGRGKVGEGWSKYGRQSWRYFGLTILVSLIFLLIVALAAGPFFVHMLSVFRHLSPDQINQNPFRIFGAIFPLIGIFLLLGFLWGCVIDAILQDFLLPPMAVEDAPLEGVFRRFFDLLRAHPGSVVLYLLLRALVSVAISAAMMIGVILVMMALGFGGAALGFVLYAALWHGGLGARSLFIVYCVVGALILLAVYFLALVVVYGTIAVFKQSYAVYFYGSHYPALGDLLESPQEAAFLPSAEPPPPPPPLVPLQEPPALW